LSAAGIPQHKTAEKRYSARSSCKITVGLRRKNSGFADGRESG
jgi:hypothetical protein